MCSQNVVHRSFFFGTASISSLDLRKTVNPRRAEPTPLPTLPGRSLFLLPCLGHTLDRGRGFSHCAAPFLFSCLFLQDLRLSRFPRPAPRVDLNHRALLCHLLRGLFLGLIVIVGRLGEEMRILYGVIAIGVVIKRRFRYLWSVNSWRRELHRIGLAKQL